MTTVSSRAVFWSQLYAKEITPEETKIEIWLHESHNFTSFTRKMLLFAIVYLRWKEIIMGLLYKPQHVWAPEKQKQNQKRGITPHRKEGFLSPGNGA